MIVFYFGFGVLVAYWLFRMGMFDVVADVLEDIVDSIDWSDE